MIDRRHPNYRRYLTDPLYHAMVDTVAKATLAAIEEADGDFDERSGKTSWEWRRERVTVAILSATHPHKVGLLP